MDELKKFFFGLFMVTLAVTLARSVVLRSLVVYKKEKKHRGQYDLVSLTKQALSIKYVLNGKKNALFLWERRKTAGN